jgi:hypothetical protein
MHCRQRSVGHIREKGQMKAVEMEVKNIEAVRAFPDFSDHALMRRYIPRKLIVES